MLTLRSDDRSSRGQALVEFAIVLPLLALLLVMAIDFGRVFFGWVSVTNAARIGADYAAQFPDAWASGNTAQQDRFERLIRDNNAGCEIDDIDDPAFTDVTGDGDPRGSSDHATVTLTCSLEMLTPLASIVVGHDVAMTAEATFPVRGIYAGPGTGGTGNPPCSGVRVPDLRLMTVTQATEFWADAGFSGVLTASPTGQPDYIVQTQATTPTANINDCVDPTTTIFVTANPPPPCPAGQAQVPNMIGALLPDARAMWSAAGFGGGFTPSSGNNTKAVITQTTSPSQVLPGGCLIAATGSVTVTYGDPPPAQCSVPNMVGHPSSEATTMWTAAGFTRTLTVQGPSGVVLTQDPQFPAFVNCDIQGKVRTN
jgi:beta-lactam-binding protein with PASTA domain